MAAAPFQHLPDQDRELLLPSPPSMSSSPTGFAKIHNTSSMKPLHLQPYANRNYEQLNDASHEDATLKYLIRRLRIYARLLSLLISLGILLPITLTLSKYLSTRHITRTLPSGQTRTAWAIHSRVWPTWAYFGVALTSTVLNAATLASYACGVGQANTASWITSAATWAGNCALWGVAAGVYRAEKDKGGKSDDLWGWTCSAAARAIQGEFQREVDFGRYCGVQSASWYIGLVQVGAAALTVVIYVLVYRRKKSKERLEQQLHMTGFEPARQ